jgi:hypothetical protein
VQERRASARVPLQVRAAIQCEGSSAQGWLCGFSPQGARIEDSGLQPPPGALVRVVFWTSAEVCCELQGRVVRAADVDGFALRFEAADAGLKRGLSELAASIGELPTL